MNATEWLLLLLLTVLWGGSFFFGKVTLADLPPFTSVWGRVTLGALLLLAFLRATGGALPRDWRSWAAFAGMGVLNNVIPFSLIMWGQTQINSGLASILNAATPLATAVLAHLLTPDEKLTPARLLGVLLGFGGVVVLVGPTALAGLGHDLAAQLACIGATISYACAGIFGRRFRRLPSMTVAAGQVCASAVMIAPVALLVDRPWGLPMPSPTTWSALIGMALFSTALGYIVYFRILATAGATNLLLVTLLMPAVALLLGAGVLGEAVTPGQLAGLALIGLGLAVIDGRAIGFARRQLAG